jgi:NSS family neurotransmitter:Na+ symporter
MFYALLVFAALTSTISMHEIGTAFFTEEFHMPRKYAAWVLTIIASVLCVLCSWSVGAIDIKVLGVSLMDFCDQLTANVMLPLGGMLACLFVGWYIPRQLVFDEFTNNGQHNQMFYCVFLFAVRYVCPVCIILVFLHQLRIL